MITPVAYLKVYFLHSYLNAEISSFKGRESNIGKIKYKKSVSRFIAMLSE